MRMISCSEILFDVLIHNTGVYLDKRSLTVDGLETNFVVHFLAYFIINHHLLEKYKNDKKGGISLFVLKGKGLLLGV